MFRELAFGLLKKKTTLNIKNMYTPNTPDDHSINSNWNALISL